MLHALDSAQHVLMLAFPDYVTCQSKSAAYVYADGHFSGFLNPNHFSLQQHSHRKQIDDLETILYSHMRQFWSDTVQHLEPTLVQWARPDKQLSRYADTLPKAIKDCKFPVIVLHRNKDGVKPMSSVDSLEQALRDEPDVIFSSVALHRPPSAVRAPLEKKQSASGVPAARSRSTSHASKHSGSRRSSVDGRSAVGDDPTSWAHYDLAAHKFLIAADCAVLSASIVNPEPLSAQSLLSVHKIANEWRCGCARFSADSACFHSRSAEALVEAEEPILDDSQAKQEPAIELIPHRAWAVAGSGYSKEFVVVLENAEVDYHCFPRSNVLCCQWVCSARSCKSACSHVVAAQQAADPEIVKLYAAFKEKKDSKARIVLPDLKPISKRDITFPLTPAVCDLLSSGCDSHTHFPSFADAGSDGKGADKRLRPVLPNTPCACGSLYSSSNYVSMGPLSLHLSQGTVQSERFALDCPHQNPECRIVFEGDSHALWIASSTTAYSLEVLASCLDQVNSILSDLSH